ncbi:NAD(P)-dependent oxidoreductase [Tamlana sp. 2_MG-2023]|uniref:NAD(P)-dependent oxidoreductase n=1 Tax=unclassified Tamlana TaxID=2614803 RepID=UPI0026E46F91|nr:MULTISPECIES: NAD(P)-dependent oxidoreductase [unclassified Tamlana]MDO6760199.1 NAD(P)-dependent oxidoreductase [Tamlana sp. 2_MG-2023]MDO6790103.1 NAD(P)-dependent oxidoreductase [Tamlana sp. 1_MG-2023]
MNQLKIAIIKERKTPPDRRVVLSPEQLLAAKQRFPQVVFKIEASNIRVFSDEAYQKAGFEVSRAVSNCDVFIGIKEVPVEALIPNKTYLFFSHTIKKQVHNRSLLKAVLDKNITLIDFETMVNSQGKRLLGFGKYAGIVGTYNGLRTWGLKYDTWQLHKAGELNDQHDLLYHLKKLKLPNLKILATGNGRVAKGVEAMLDVMHIKAVSVDAFLNNTFHEPVYCKIHVGDYYKHKAETVFNKIHFYENPQDYESDFMKFARMADLLFAGHFYSEGAPYFYTKEDVQSSAFNIKVVADISCDVNGPLATTLRSSNIEAPIYGYDPKTGQETDFKNKNAIAVMAVSNLPCELPKDASEGFGEVFLEEILPAFFNNDKDGILRRAKITENGKLTKRFKYLQDYVGGNEHF